MRRCRRRSSLGSCSHHRNRRRRRRARSRRRRSRVCGTRTSSWHRRRGGCSSCRRIARCRRYGGSTGLRRLGCIARRRRRSGPVSRRRRSCSIGAGSDRGGTASGSCLRHRRRCRRRRRCSRRWLVGCGRSRRRRGVWNVHVAPSDCCGRRLPRRRLPRRRLPRRRHRQDHRRQRLDGRRGRDGVRPRSRRGDGAARHERAAAARAARPRQALAAGAAHGCSDACREGGAHAETQAVRGRRGGGGGGAEAGAVGRVRPPCRGPCYCCTGGSAVVAVSGLAICRLALRSRLAAAAAVNGVLDAQHGRVD